MVSIGELMEHGSRRKIEKFAQGMGYEPAEEYPDEVLDELLKRNGHKESVSEKAHNAAEAESATGAAIDLESVQAAAENRAAGLLIALDALTMMRCADKKFKDPHLQAAVDESGDRLKQMLVGVGSYYNPESFLSSTLQAERQLGGSGTTGWATSPSSSSDDLELSSVEIDS